MCLGQFIDLKNNGKGEDNEDEEIITWLFITISNVCLGACGGSAESSTSAEQDDVIRIGFQKGNTLHILKESGFLEEAAKEKGITIQWEMFTHGGTLMEG